MKLHDYGESLAYEVAFWIQGVENPGYPIEELGKLSLEVSEKLRALAIIVLLTQGETDFFYHDLIRSGRSRARYLFRINESRRFEDHHWCSGRYEPLLDAVAAGDFALARGIVALSPSEFREGHEYEDDYYYSQILHGWVMEPAAEQDVNPLLGRWKLYLEDLPSSRLTVCRALAATNQADFDEAFAALLTEREAQIEADKERGQLEEPHIVAQRRVFIEGLALLRLAEKRGLTTESEYRYCPSLARRPMETPFPGE